MWVVVVVPREPAVARDSRGGDGRLADIATGGGVVAAAVLLLASSAQFMPAVAADEESTIDPAVATAMSDCTPIWRGPSRPAAFGVLVVATAVIGQRSGLLARWLSWSACCWGSADRARGTLGGDHVLPVLGPRAELHAVPA